MDTLDKLFARMKGEDPDQEKIKKNAQQGIAEHEARTGTKYAEEPGIEPDEITESIMTAPLTGGASIPGVARSLGGAAVRQAEKSATKSALDKIKEGGMPQAKPTFSEGVAAGAAAPGGSGFAKFIRQAEQEAPAGPGPKAGPVETVMTSTATKVNPRIKALQDESQFLNMKTPEGRARAAEIDKLLKNRTYFQGN